MLVVYMTLTGQARRFVEKLPFVSYELSTAFPSKQMTADFVVVAPTYDIEMTGIIDDFIDYQDNHRYFKGVAGSGNRNFAELYVFTARDLAKKYDVPIIAEFEFDGTEKDVAKFIKGVESIGNTSFTQ